MHAPRVLLTLSGVSAGWSQQQHNKPIVPEAANRRYLQATCDYLNSLSELGKPSTSWLPAHGVEMNTD